MSVSIRRLALDFVCAVLALTVASCTGDADDTTPPVTSQPSNGATAGQSAGTVDGALPASRKAVWREHVGPGPGTFQNADATVPAGAYRLVLACAGGSVGVDVNGVRQRDIECSGQAESIPVCVANDGHGLAVSAEWIRGPFGDLAWQLVPHEGDC